MSPYYYDNKLPIEITHFTRNKLNVMRKKFDLKSFEESILFLIIHFEDEIIQEELDY